MKNTEEVAIRIRVFELFVEVEKKGTVARLLNEEGCKTRRGKEWRDVHIGRLLACTSGRGQFPTNKTRLEGGTRVAVPESDWEYIPCPAIIEKALWDTAHAVLERQASSNSNPTARTPKQPFSGLTICECGVKMRVATTKKFVCGSCANKVSISDLERSFEAEFRDMILPRLLASESHPADPDKIEIEQIKEQMETLEELYHNGKIHLDRFGERHSELEEKLESLSSQKEHIERGPGSKHIDIDPEEFLSQWRLHSTTDRLRLIDTLIDKIVIRRDIIEFSCRISDSLEEAPTSLRITDPTNQDPVVIERDEPVYIKLPKSGQRCSKTGMSRSALNDLILPRRRNGFDPPVKSFNRKDGAGRLVVWASLKAYLDSAEPG